MWLGFIYLWFWKHIIESRGMWYVCINFHLRAFSIYLFYILANSQTLGCIFINKVYHHFLQPGSIYHLPPFSFLKCNDLSKKKVFSQTVFVLCLLLREFFYVKEKILVCFAGFGKWRIEGGVGIYYFHFGSRMM